MKNNLLLAITLLSSTILSSNIWAQVSISINQDGNLPSAYYGSGTTGFSNNTGNGITVGTDNGGHAWNIGITQDISANRNSANAIFIENGGKASFDGMNNDILVDDNSNGLVADGIGSEIKIKNANLIVSNTNKGGGNPSSYFAISAANGSNIDISGNGNNNLYLADNNSRGVYSNASTIKITNMNIYADNNRTAIATNNGGNASISSIYNNMLEIVNSTVEGINIVDFSVLNISGMNMNVTDNVYEAIKVGEAAEAYITGDGNQYLKMNNNGRSGVRVVDADSVMNITNMNIEANENGLHGIFAESGGKINVIGNEGNTLEASRNKSTDGTNGRGIYAVGDDGTGNGSEINIKNTNVISNSNWFQNIFAHSLGKINIEGNNNYLIAGSSQSTHGISANNGQIIISNMNIELSNNYRAGVESYNGAEISIKGNGNSLILDSNNIEGSFYTGVFANGVSSVLNIYGMNIYAQNNDVFGARNGGEVNLDKTSVFVADSSKLAIFDTGIGTLTATNSSLMNQIETSNTVVSNIILTNTDWSNIGRSNISNYTASNASIFMNILFASSASNNPLLTIENSSTGDTTLHITSTGTDGGQDDVLVVDQSGMSSSNANAVFSLAGGVADSGAYEYELAKDYGNNNWYLTSTGRMSGTAKALANVPAIHLSIIKTGMNELRKRLGELRNNDPKSKDGAWVRTYAKHLKVNDTADAKMNLYGIEAGYDQQVYADADNKVYTGIMTGYEYTDNIKTKLLRSKSTGHAKTPSLGAYATWLNSSGWFADATIREFWSSMEASNKSASGNIIKYDPDRNFTTASFELGRQIRKDNFIIEPKAEVQYAYSKAKSFNTNIGNKIHYGKTESFVTRTALMTGYSIKADNGAVWEPFVEVGVGKEWSGTTDITYAGSDFKSDVNGFVYDVIIGVNTQIDDKWSVYGETSYEFGPVYKGIGANIGMRYSF